MRTTFDCDGLVDDITLNSRSGCQADLKATHTTNNAAIDDNIVAHNFAFNGGTFANRQKMGANVAFDLTFDLDIARGLHVASDQQIR